MAGRRSTGGRKKKLLPKVLSEKDLDALLAAPSRRSIMGVRDRCIMSLLGKLGLRVSEACSLNLNSVHLDADDPHIRVMGKGSKERRVWLGRGMIDLIEHWLELHPRKGKALFPVVQRSGGKRTWGETKQGRGISRRSVGNMVKHFAKKAGIRRHVHPHMLRHTFATVALRKGIDLRKLQKMLGHADISTTEIYTHVTGGEMAEAARRLDPGHAPAPPARDERLAELKQQAAAILDEIKRLE